MKKLYLYVLMTFRLIFLLGFGQFVYAQETRIFSSLDEVWNEVKNRNLVFQNADLQSEIASLAYKTSLGNVLNPRMPLSATMINNTKLQQNFIPAEAFGGPAGSFREVTLGQQYNTLFSFQPQFDIINMSNIAQIKAAKINMMLTQSQNDLNTFALHQNVNVTYHNILSFQKQKEILLENLAAAEKIENIVNNRFEEGIARKQELNEAEVNVINLRDKIEQLDINVQIQKQRLCFLKITFSLKFLKISPKMFLTKVKYRIKIPWPTAMQSFSHLFCVRTSDLFNTNIIQPYLLPLHLIGKV